MLFKPFSTTFNYIQLNVPVYKILQPFLPAAFYFGFALVDGVLAKVFERELALLELFAPATVEGTVALFSELFILRLFKDVVRCFKCPRKCIHATNVGIEDVFFIR